MASDRPGIPRLVFDEPSFSGHQQFELAHDSVTPAFDTAPLGPVDGFRGRSTDFLLGDIALTSIDFTAQSLTRTRRHFATSTTDMLAVLVPRSGSVLGEVGRDTRVEAGVGTALVLDFAEPFHLRSDGADLLWLSLPRSRVVAADRLRHAGTAATLDATTPAGRAVIATIETTWDELAGAPAEQAPELAERLADVVDGALAPGAFIPAPDALLASMKSFLREHLDDFDLGVDDLRGAFHCSRSSVYRLFEADGGVASFIRRERLQRCFHELSSHAEAPRRVSAVAGRWGFENPSHFNRLFKATFGAAPSVIAGQARTTPDRYRPDLSDQILRLHDWIGA